MTEPLTVTELDERTKEELQPPCSWRRVRTATMERYDHCSAAAVWVVRFKCSQCGTDGTNLACDYHMNRYLVEPGFCSKVCHEITGVVVSVTRL